MGAPGAIVPLFTKDVPDTLNVPVPVMVPRGVFVNVPLLTVRSPPVRLSVPLLVWVAPLLLIESACATVTVLRLSSDALKSRVPPAPLSTATVPWFTNTPLFTVSVVFAGLLLQVSSIVPALVNPLATVSAVLNAPPCEYNRSVPPLAVATLPLSALPPVTSSSPPLSKPVLTVLLFNPITWPAALSKRPGPFTVVLLKRICVLALDKSAPRFTVAPLKLNVPGPLIGPLPIPNCAELAVNVRPLRLIVPVLVQLPLLSVRSPPVRLSVPLLAWVAPLLVIESGCSTVRVPRLSSDALRSRVPPAPASTATVP